MGKVVAGIAVIAVFGYVLYKAVLQPYIVKSSAQDHLQQAEILKAQLTNSEDKESLDGKMRYLVFTMNKVSTAVDEIDEADKDLLNVMTLIKSKPKGSPSATAGRPVRVSVFGYPDQADRGNLLAFTVRVRTDLPQVSLLQVRTWLAGGREGGGEWTSEVAQQIVNSPLRSGMPWEGHFQIAVPGEASEEFVVRGLAVYRLDPTGSDQEVEDPAPRRGVSVHR